MKDIALVIPNTPFLINQKVFPNIGILRVATELKNNGYSVDVLDFKGKESEDIIPYSNNYKYFGFSSTTPEIPYVMKMLKEIKRYNNVAKTIIGGAHPSALYQLKIKNIYDKNIKDLEDNFDTIFSGEGENIENIFKEGWQRGGISKNIDDKQIPDRDLLDLKSYNYFLNDKKTTCVMTQRGCPHQCVFCCGRDIEMYNKVRFHSPERVLEELDLLNEKYGYESCMLYDDEINVNSSRLEKLCNKLKDRKYQFRGFSRSDMIVKYPESVKWMKDAGFIKLCSGVESGSNRILKILNKRASREQNSLARQIIGREGIHYESFLLMGLPEETKEDVELTIDWIKENNPDDFDINIVVPYPGSKIYDESIPSKKYLNYDWEYKGLYFNKPRYIEEESYYKGLEGKGKVHSRTDDMDEEYLINKREEIHNLRKNAQN